MTGGLTEEERLLQATAREFAARELAPTAIERDEAERFDRSLFTKMGELGLTAAPLPESVGGAGFSYLGWTLVMEELGAADMASAVSLSVHILSQYPVVTWGTPEQHARWLPAMLAGEALGRLRPDRAARRQRRRGDPDPGRADRTGRRADGLPPDRHQDLDLERARGRPLSRLRDARSERPAPRRSRRSSSRRGRPGFRFGAHEKKMGIRACPAAELVFDGAEVPVANRLGGEGEGYRIALSALGEGRISIAAACVGIARAGLEAAARYLQQRRAFGAPLAEQQGIRFMLAEMAREVAAARAVTRVAAAAKDRGEPIAEVSSIAKWTASDAAMRVATDAVQLFGASGYSRETGVERLMRDAKGAQIYEGTNQIHRLIVADEVLRAVGNR